MTKHCAALHWETKAGEMAGFGEKGEQRQRQRQGRGETECKILGTDENCIYVSAERGEGKDKRGPRGGKRGN